MLHSIVSEPVFSFAESLSAVRSSTNDIYRDTEKAKLNLATTKSALASTLIDQHPVSLGVRSTSKPK